jgi:hypothetical protein
MPLSSDQQAALTRLQSYYEGNNPYNSVTNPGGFRQGGHVYNFVSALKDVATVCVGIASLAADVATNSAQSPKAVRVDATQTFTAAEQTQGQTNLGIASAIATAVKKTGDTMTGPLTLSYSGPILTFKMVGGTYDKAFWDWQHYPNDGHFYLQYQAPDGTNSNVLNISPNGAITTSQLGDLVLNGTVGSQGLGIRFTFPSNADWGLRTTTGNRFQFCDGAKSVEYLSIGTDGSVSTKQLGDLNTRIENRAAAYANNAQTGAYNSCVSSTRLAYVGDQSVAANFGGGMHEDYGASWISGRSSALSNDQQDIIITILRYRQLQQYIPNSGGWVASYYA